MTKAPTCSHPGCSFSSRSKGLCSKHGTPRSRRYCSVDQCKNHCRGKDGLCYRHRIKDDSNTSTTVVKAQNRQKCRFDNCDKVARGKHGFCSNHYRITFNTKLPSTNRKQTSHTPVISILKIQVDVLEKRKQKIELQQRQVDERLKVLREKIIRMPSIEYDVAKDNEDGEGNEGGQREDGGGGDERGETKEGGGGDQGGEGEEGGGVACLHCGDTYKIYEVQKFFSRKCNHHFCENCIKNWREGWDETWREEWEGDATFLLRRREPDTPVTTKKCLYEKCNVYHDRMGGEQSFDEDKRTMCNLLIESIQLDDNNKIHLQTKKSRNTFKERRIRSLTCG